MMDPITTAIITALSAGATKGIQDTAKTAITDGYNKLKGLLIKKFGASSDVIQAVEKLEAKPESQGRKEMLQEEIAIVKAEQDRELLALAEHIHQMLKKEAKDNTAIQQIITGNYNATSVHGDATVTIQQPKDM